MLKNKTTTYLSLLILLALARPINAQCPSPIIVASSNSICAGNSVTLTSVFPQPVVTYTSIGATTWTAPSGVTNVTVLVVAGGGGGGYDGGGGGGGGGVIYNTSYSVTPTNTYVVTVGAGGAALNYYSVNGFVGGNSVFGTLTAVGGDGGYNNHAQQQVGVGNGRTGGSGGGQGAPDGTISGPGFGTSGQGYNGGTSTLNTCGGGGGGAGGVGLSASNNTPGNGGIGFLSSITGTVTYYGGGGGGGSWGTSNTGFGGLGGGGNGGTNTSPINGANGISTTGGGGGGSGVGGSISGIGGSGIVIIKYNVPSAASYTWSTGANTSSIVVSPTVTTTYSVVSTNTAACTATSAPITITVTQLTAQITGANTVCAGTSVTLTPMISSGAGSLVISTFTNSGASTWTVPSGVNSISLTVVGGGGGGGGDVGGGGGGGQVINLNNYSVAPGQVLNFNIASQTGYPSGYNAPGQNGGTTTLSGGTGGTITAIGGNGGRARSGPGANVGWNGGGGSYDYNTSNAGNGGFAGGNAWPNLSCGGGGGSGGVGQNATNTTPGSGGIGIQSIIDGVFYGGGGGGGQNPNSILGTGTHGGGNGGSTNPYSAGQDAALNRGSGGGGGPSTFTNPNAGRGSSGIIIIGYSVPSIAIGTFTWSNGANTSSITINPTVTTSYSVAFTTTTGCIGTSTLTAVNVNPLPVLSISGSSAICVGQTATLVANGANTYTWSNASTASSITLSPASNTSYSLTGTAAGCIGSATRNLTVNPNPIITVNSGAICAGQNFTINPNGANTYTIQGGNAVVSPAGNTSYTVAGTSTAGCVSQAFATSNLIVNANPIITVNNGVICAGQNFTINPNGANTYTIQGGSAVVSPTSNASFTVSGTSGAGCVSQAVATSSLIVNPNPTITVNNGTICVGQNFTINPNGANTYTIQGGNAVVSPPSNSSYTVIGTNSVTGCRSQAFATSSLLVNANPIITVNNGTICAGQNFTINPNGANTYTIQGGNAVVSPPSNAIFTVAGTSTAGCVSQAVATSSLIVNQNPTITVNNGAICAGQNFTINPNGANTYTIQGGSAVVSPAGNTSFTVAGTSTAGCLSQAFATSNLTVNPNPTVSISGASGICTGQNASLTANGATTYTWSTGSNSASIITTPTANTTYTLTGSTPQGCSSFTTQLVTVQLSLSVSIAGPTTICYGQAANLSGLGGVTYTWNTGATTATVVPTLTTTTTFSLIGASGTCSNTASKTISVTPNPTVTITGTNAICAGGSTSLTVNGATTYTWSSGSTSASVVFSPSATSVYSVVGSYSTGCLNATTQTVTVYALPVVSISGPSVVCLGDSIALVANGANTYVWNNNATTTTIVITPTTTSTYSAVGTDTNGCVGLSAIDSIFVNPVPILSIISTATAICVGDTVKFTAAGASSYAWNIGDNDSLIVVTPTITTTYSVVGTNGFGCTSTKTDSIKVNALPNITISGTTGTICIGENITLTANGANTYTWSGGINTNSIAVSPSVSTTYSASGTSTDGCVGSNTLQLNVTECTNIKTIASKAAIKVYPNPNNGEFTIELTNINNSNISITNVLGQIIKTQKAELMNQIDLNLFDKGIYFISVMENNQSVYRGSIIKE